MSVLIKGMDMPKSCESCPCKTSDAFGGLGCQATGYIPLRKANQDRPDWCPFVPVPSHGRLIDADAPIPLVDTHGKKIEVTVAHIIENNLGIVNAIIEAEDD